MIDILASLSNAPHSPAMGATWTVCSGLETVHCAPGWFPTGALAVPQRVPEEAAFGTRGALQVGYCSRVPRRSAAHVVAPPLPAETCFC